VVSPIQIGRPMFRRSTQQMLVKRAWAQNIQFQRVTFHAAMEPESTDMVRPRREYRAADYWKACHALIEGNENDL
jgi:hypothetical protein